MAARATWAADEKHSKQEAPPPELLKLFGDWAATDRG